MMSICCLAVRSPTLAVQIDLTVSYCSYRKYFALDVNEFKIIVKLDKKDLRFGTVLNSLSTDFPRMVAVTSYEECSSDEED